MSQSLRQYAYVAAFRCSGQECPDTCCTGWGLPADSRQQALYAEHAPELLDAIDTESRIMKCNSAGNCTQWEGGLCRIHARYGSDYLSDSCHFYPRVLRRNEQGVIQSANLSCPEIARLILELDDPFALTEAPIDRLPLHMPHADNPNASAISSACLAYVLNPSRPPAHALANLIALGSMPAEAWPAHLASSAPSGSSQPEPADIFRVFYGLHLLAILSGQTGRVRLEAILRTMQTRLQAGIDHETRTLQLQPGAAQAADQLQNDAIQHHEQLDQILRRWLAAQLTIWDFPFGGYPSLSMPERLNILALRFAIVRLALQCHLPLSIPAANILHPLSRLLDHMGDPTLMLDICRDAGWADPERLQSMLRAG